MANVEALQSTLAWIEEHPEQHDQQSWAVKGSCGTTMCFAGAAVMLAGHALDWPSASTHLDDEGISYSLANFCAVPPRHPDGDDRGLAPICHVAKRVLELNDDETALLFHDCCDIADLKNAVAFIADELVRE